MSAPTRLRGAIERLTTDEVCGRVIRDGSSEPVEIEVRANGQPRALGRAEEVLGAGRLGYRVRVALAPGEVVEVHAVGGALGRVSKSHIVPPAGPFPSFGVGAIFRNEAPYVTEWIAHHRLMGFRDIFVADNESDDGTWELLQALESLGYVKCFRFALPPAQPPQLPSYVELMHRFGKQVDWMAFIDADELIWPTNGERTAIPSLAGLASRPEVGAIVLNWAVHGSSGHTNHAAGLVMERFQRCAPRRFTPNHHYKTVLRTAAWSGAFKNPHLALLEAPWQMTHVNGAPVVHHPRHGAGLSSEVVWDILRLNHYAVKSRQEFEERKRPKASASRLGKVKGEVYFTNHDRNDAPAPVPEWARSRLAEEVARIEAELLSAGHAPAQRPTAAVVLARPFEGDRGTHETQSLDAPSATAVAFSNGRT